MKDRIRNCLAELKPRILTDGFARQAAVLMPVFQWENEYHFLLTRRTEEVQTHKGQISFPGGMREDNEDLVKTALRETFEEVGIEANRIEILGGFMITCPSQDSVLRPSPDSSTARLRPCPRSAKLRKSCRFLSGYSRIQAG